MKKIALVTGALLALCASTSFAAGINLSWGECGTGAGATSSLSWACNANLAATTAPKIFAVASFIPPASAQPVVGIESIVEWTSAATPLDPWWQFGTQGDGGAAGCRSTNLVPKFDASALGQACNDYFGPLTPVGGGLTYWGNSPGAGGSPVPNQRSGFIKIQVAAPFDQASALDPGTEYYGFYLSIDKQKTVGATACAGCADAVCVTLDYVTVFYADNSSSTLNNAINNNKVAWQVAGTPPATCAASTPVKAKTWGAVKSLYR